MTELIVEFAAESPEEASWRFDPAEAGFDDLIELWRRKIYAPYVESFIDKYGGTARKMELAWQLCDKPISLEVLFDHTFLDQALEVYATHGWAALEALKQKAEKKQTPATRTFIEATLWIVSVRIGQELVRVEGRLMGLAKSEWGQARDQLEGYLKHFESIGAGAYKFRHQFRDRKKGKQAFKLCAEYARELQKFEDYQKSLNVRNSKDRYDPAKKLDRTYAQKLWHELYASPQREVMKTMSRIINELGPIFPPAVLVLADLPKDMSKPIKSDEGADYWNRARALDDLIYDNLAELKAQLIILQASMQRPSQSDKLRAYIAKPGPLPGGGAEALVFNGAWEAEPEDNRVFADVGLIERLLEQVEERHPVSWEHAVLKRYYVYVKDEVDKRKQSQKDWDKVWGWVGRVTAALSLLALLAFPPFGLGAVGVAPAIATALSIVGSAAIALAVITLLVDLFDLFTREKEQAAKELREQMYKLGQTDPEALNEVGAVLHRNHELRAAMTTGLFLTLFKLALAKKIKPVALALELDGFLDDMQTLFAAPVIYNE